MGKHDKGRGTTPVLLVTVADRSGSMNRVRSDMEEAYAAFIAEQQKLPGKCRASLYQFDAPDGGHDWYQAVYENVSIAKVPRWTLEPRGWTALYDAIGRAILSTDAVVAKLAGEMVVFFTIITDGLNNSSREYTAAMVKQMITERTDAGWKFTYLGANQDSFVVAEGMGIPHAATMNYAQTAGGVAAMTNSVSGNAARTRGPGGQSRSIGYAEAERAAAMDKRGGSST